LLSPHVPDVTGLADGVVPFSGTGASERREALHPTAGAKRHDQRDDRPVEHHLAITGRLVTGRRRNGTIAVMHGIPIVVGSVALVLITVVDVLVITKLPRSRRLPSWFLHYFVFSSIVAGIVVGFLTRGR
jgi:hypothetical protein